MYKFTVILTLKPLMMKKAIYLLTLLLSSFMFSQSTFEIQEDMKWTRNWTSFDPNNESYNEADEIISNIIDTDLTLDGNKTYLMTGNVYVTNNATLTIEPGTLIRCESRPSSTLIVTQGAKLIAEGTIRLPIIFTSNKPLRARRAGDWGGIVVIGSGKTNSPSNVGFIEGNHNKMHSMYGSSDETNEEDETTRISYLRIEYAGQKINTNQSSNGLSLYALGSKSIINNVMVSYSGDDSFEFFGGTCNLNNLISYKSKDDDFDFTLGFKGTLKDIMAIRHPFISDLSGSYAIEIDGFDKDKGVISQEDFSDVQIVNASLINLSDKSNYQHTTAAISSNNLAKLKFSESRISGFSNVVKFDKSFKSYSIIEKSFNISNSLCNVYDKNVISNHEGITTQVASGVLKYNMFTKKFTSVKDLFENPLDNKNPEFVLKSKKDNYAILQQIN